MKQEMKGSDKVLYTPPGDTGPTFCIYYQLPREKDEHFLAQATEFLIRVFQTGLLSLCEEIHKETNYNFERFTRKIKNRGGLKTVKSMLQPDSTTTGMFKSLASKGRLDLSVEYFVLQMPWYNLFTKSELAVAKKRLFDATGLSEFGPSISYLADDAICSIELNSYEKDLEAKQLCLEHFGPVCIICNIDFEYAYGSIGKNFIQVHHIVPASSIPKRYIVDPIRDLRPVCPNCHAMLHTQEPPYTIDQIKDVCRARYPSRS
ncbi:HNH endonuclease [Spirosoma linguale]